MSQKKQICPCKVSTSGHVYSQHTPECLDKIADVVLNYRPKSKQPKPRKRKKAKKAK